MKPIICILFMLLILNLFACKKDKQKPIATTTSTLLQNDQAYFRTNSVLGIWTWYKTIGPWLMGVTTPQSTNGTRQIHFLADSTVRFYKNGLLERTTTWKFQRGGFFSPSPTSDTTLGLYIGGLQAYFNIKEDSLSIQTMYRDGEDDYYKWSYQHP